MQNAKRRRGTLGDDRKLPAAWGPWLYRIDWTEDQLAAVVRELGGETIGLRTKLRHYTLLHSLHPEELSPAEELRFRRIRNNSRIPRRIHAPSESSCCQCNSSYPSAVAQAREPTPAYAPGAAPRTPNHSTSFRFGDFLHQDQISRAAAQRYAQPRESAPAYAPKRFPDPPNYSISSVTETLPEQDHISRWVTETEASAHPLAATEDRYQMPKTQDPESESGECSWCGESKPAALMLGSFRTSTCAHPPGDPPCRQCAQEYISQKAASDDWTKITCPEYKCNENFQHRDMQRYASKADLAQYELTLSTRAVESEYVNCAHEQCTGGGFCDPETDSFFICPTCMRKTCASCQRKWHLDRTCAQQKEEDDANTPGAVAAARLARRAEEEASARVVRNESVPCPNPNCQYDIQKAAGCDHMTCRQCNWEFCIRCLAPWDAIARYGNDGHRRDCPYHSDNISPLWQGHTNDDDSYNDPLQDRFW